MPKPRLAAGPAIRLLLPDWCDVLGGVRGLVPAGVLLQLLELRTIRGELHADDELRGRGGGRGLHLREEGVPPSVPACRVAHLHGHRSPHWLGCFSETTGEI